jgi:glycosyltransferase involved in cell wall biosynthesis
MTITAGRMRFAYKGCLSGVHARKDLYTFFVRKNLMHKPKVIAIFIAYNAEKTLEEFWQAFPKDAVDCVILVDDRSKDNTFALAQKLGIPAHENNVNLGYGGNMKRAIALALQQGADIIVDIHPDGEYKPNAILPAIEAVKNGAKLVLGSRFSAYADLRRRGMYWWKIPFLMGMTLFHQLVLGTRIKDLHQGFRVYTRELLEHVPFERNSNIYLFSYEIIAQAFFNRMKVATVPVETRYTGEKRGASLKSSIKYSLGTFKVSLLYLLAKLGIKTKIFRKPERAFAERVEELSRLDSVKAGQ